MLLVTSRNHNGWVVPGGGIESGEKAEHAAIRELQEEACVPETFYIQVINFTICHLQAGVVGAIIGSLGIFNVGKIICDLNILKCLFCHMVLYRMKVRRRKLQCLQQLPLQN